MPLISVIMPVYNNERYFPLAVQRVLNQSFKDFELIIVDDGSTDKTAEIADEFAHKDARVHVIHQENQWIYASYNNGVQRACGEYVLIINSDDLLREGVLQIMEDNLRMFDYPDVIWANVLIHLCDEEQNIYVYDKKKRENSILHTLYFRDKKEVRTNWIHIMEKEIEVDQVNLYKTSLVKQHPFRNDIPNADNLFNINIANDISRSVLIKEPIYDHFRYNSERAASTKYFDSHHGGFNEAYFEYKKLFSEWQLSSDACLRVLAQRRMGYLTHELRMLGASNCTLTIEEKIKCIFLEYVDEIMLECASILDAEEELESRVLSGVRELLVKEELPKESEMYFVYELLDSLLRYEKDEEDYQKIEYAINHPLNPHRIGEIFYRKLKTNIEG